MPKHDFFTPKAIANRMKAKGLQKLRWFCQVCQKQCRDENGFKCHTSSESHQRQMLIVASNPGKFMNQYSRQFENAFLENLRRRHGTKRMRANVVYNEYIQDKLHVHMNATQWTTLSGFVQYLGRTGKCVVDETEKGWYIQYIDRDPRTLARQQERKQKADLDHEERNRQFIKRQLKMAKADADDEEERPTKLQRTAENEKIRIALAKTDTTTENKKKLAGLADVFAVTEPSASQEKETVDAATKSRSAIDAIMAENEYRKQKVPEVTKRHENWIMKQIIVKVLNKKVGDGKYYKEKGVITAVEDKFCATVEMLASGDVLRLDQDDLETVIPKAGRRVMIVNGTGRGCIGTLLSITVEDFCATVRIDSGPRKYVMHHLVCDFTHAVVVSMVEEKS